MAKVRIIDVAEKAGVSKSTVSNYLNGKTQKISENTANRIQEVIKELNYAPSLAARKISSKQKTKTIGIVIPETLGSSFSSNFYTGVMGGISDTAEDLGYRVIFFPCHRDDQKKDIEYIRGLSSGMVDGFLLFGIEKGDKFIKEFDFDGIPYVCFGFSESFYSDLRYIASDHISGIEQAVSHLIIEHHMKDIALFLSSRKMNVEIQKIEGYESAFKKAKIEYDTENVIWGVGEKYDYYHSCINLLNRGVEAFVIPQNALPSFKKACQDYNKKIGSDVKLILTDFFQLDYYDNSFYSYLNLPVYDIGVEGIRRLVNQITQVDEVKENRLYPISLTIGRSCGCSI